MASSDRADAEWLRLDEDHRRVRNWRRWGPYLAERQWGTVREDYSATGECWSYLPHDHARSRAYRWGEDGLLGICDRECRVCFSIALWNGKDPILKERLFGLTGPEGNHGEDCKELYYYLDATPTASYLAALYKYPQAAYPYQQLVDSGARGKGERELELEDTGAFADNRYFDVKAEYAKAGTDDVLIRITCTNRGPDAATLHVLPTLWLRNSWAWGRVGEGYDPAGNIARVTDTLLSIEQPTLGTMQLAIEKAAPLLFTNNETNNERLWNVPSATPYTKDAFHRHVIAGDAHAINPEQHGTKAAAWVELALAAGESRVIRLRLSAKASAPTRPFADFDDIVAERLAEANHYHALSRDAPMTPTERAIVRQADAGLVWSRQFYHYIVEHWVEGDPAQPPPPKFRAFGRNRHWHQLWARDVIAMPDTWEYPWFAAWDLGFHCVAMARIDPWFAKSQIQLLSREWYMHPSGQLPAYEFAFGDVNPPVQAWAAWRVYELSREAGLGEDQLFLERAFQKCLVNFTWWVNREDAEGDNLFTGGFLGLDNIGVFDRSQPLPGGGHLIQADATAWMAFYCTTMLRMALELSRLDASYNDLALKFFEHFVAIAKATNELGGTGLWDEEDGFYYDHAMTPNGAVKLKIRSAVGLIPLFAAESLDDEQLHQLPILNERIKWFFANRPELARTITTQVDDKKQMRLLAIPTRQRLERVLRYMLDEQEFLSPYGIRSLSLVHRDHPYVLDLGGERREVRYAPGESESGMFGGNSNWRGPVWFPLNYLLIEALKRYDHFYGDELRVECPTGSGNSMNLGEVAQELERRLGALFVPDAHGARPCHGGAARYTDDPAFRELVLFYEYFHGDDGRGLGASHQTGWTALAGNIVERIAITREGK